FLLCIAAISGDAVGYQIGRRAGRKLFEKPNSRFFKREHLVKTEQFYEKHGPKTIVLARFVPIVRTFAPTIAGIAEMKYEKFALYNICGGIGWIVGLLGLGYYVGNLPWVKDNFEKVIIGIIILSILPMILHWWQERKAGHGAEEAIIETIAPGLEV